MKDLYKKFGISNSLIEAVKKIRQEEAEYQMKVKELMKKKGITSLSQLSPNEKKEFFNQLDSMHQGENEDDLDEGKRVSAQVKLQRAYERERERSEASRKRGQEIMAQARAAAQAKIDAENKKKQNESFTPAMIAKLKEKYGKISGIDPSSDNYKKLIAMLDKMNKKDLQTLADAEIKFVSGLARNRVNRMKNEEFELTEGMLSKFKKADAQTKMDFNKYNMKPYDAVYTVTMGAKDEPKYDLTILKHENGKFLAAHGSVVVKQEFAKAEDAAKWLMNWYEENKRPAAKNESVEESVKVGDKVHLGLKQKGGSGMRGTVHKIEGDTVHVNVGKEKFGDRIVQGFMKNVTKEEIELEEGKASTGYNLYHKDFSSAMAHAYDFAKKKYGIEVDPEEIDRKVAMGPKRPSSGKTNSYRLMGKDGKNAIQVQVANLDNKRYELNMYKEEVDKRKIKFEKVLTAIKKYKNESDEFKKGQKLSGKQEIVNIDPEVNIK